MLASQYADYCKNKRLLASRLSPLSMEICELAKSDRRFFACERQRWRRLLLAFSFDRSGGSARWPRSRRKASGEASGAFRAAARRLSKQRARSRFCLTPRDRHSSVTLKFSRMQRPKARARSQRSQRARVNFYLLFTNFVLDWRQQATAATQNRHDAAANTNGGKAKRRRQRVVWPRRLSGGNSTIHGSAATRAGQSATMRALSKSRNKPTESRRFRGRRKRLRQR